jgi:glycosyltransferase involved in cell wall biosynthesis
MASTGFDPILPERVGAIEPYVYELSKELSQGNFVDVFGRGEGKEDMDSMCIRTFKYRLRTKNISTYFQTYELFSSFLFNEFLVKNVVRLHKIYPIDVFHIHTVYTGLAAAFSKSCFHIPSVCSIHNTIRTAFPIKFCDKILANSNYIRRFLVEERSVEPSKVDVLPIAVNTDVYKPNGNMKQIKDRLRLFDSKVILFVGRKCSYKGPQILVEALPLIIRSIPNTLAVFIGPDYSFSSNSISYTEFLMAKARKLKIENHIIFKGFVSDTALRDYYNASDIVVCPSIWQEPFGKVIIEALAHEKPVVATDVGGISEVVTNGVNGFLVPPRDPKALANAILFLLENENTARQIGKEGRKNVEEKFSFKVIGKKCLEVYEELIS